MNKQELVRPVAERTGLGETGTKVTLETIMDEMSNAFKRGEGFELRGFGTFKVVNTRPKMGRNPHTGEPVPIPAGRKVKFTFSCPLSSCQNPDSSR